MDWQRVFVLHQKHFSDSRYWVDLIAQNHGRVGTLWRKTKKELGNEDAHYKDLLIQKILKQEGFGDVNEGYIRKVGR
jgi:hypothetical protein